MVPSLMIPIAWVAFNEMEHVIVVKHPSYLLEGVFFHRKMIVFYS